MKTVLILSGGMDSAVLLAHLLHAGDTIQCVNFHYGSKHNDVERERARRLVAHYGVRCGEMDIDLTMFRSSLIDPSVPVPHGHYAEESMRSTVVPFRNGIMLAYAAGFAESVGFDQVAIGAHAGDHHIYPDCRVPFIDAMRDAIREGTYKNVRLDAPFSWMTKGEIVKRGLELSVPFSMTWTCYEGGEVACGKCGSCDERRRAFEENGAKDPIPYKE